MHHSASSTTYPVRPLSDRVDSLENLGYGIEKTDIFLHAVLWRTAPISWRTSQIAPGDAFVRHGHLSDPVAIDLASKPFPARRASPKGSGLEEIFNCCSVPDILEWVSDSPPVATSTEECFRSGEVAGHSLPDPFPRGPRESRKRQPRLRLVGRVQAREPQSLGGGKPRPRQHQASGRTLRRVASETTRPISRWSAGTSCGLIPVAAFLADREADLAGCGVPGPRRTATRTRRAWTSRSGQDAPAYPVPARWGEKDGSRDVRAFQWLVIQGRLRIAENLFLATAISRAPSGTTKRNPGLDRVNSRDVSTC